MELFHPFAQVFDKYYCEVKSAEHKTDSLSQQKAEVYRHLDSLVHLEQDIIFDMFDEVIRCKKDAFLQCKSVKQTHPDIQKIVHTFIVRAEVHKGDWEAFEEELYSDFKWAFGQYKQVGGRAYRHQWTHC